MYQSIKFTISLLLVFSLQYSANGNQTAKIDRLIIESSSTVSQTITPIVNSMHIEKDTINQGSAAPQNPFLKVIELTSMTHYKIYNL